MVRTVGSQPTRGGSSPPRVTTNKDMIMTDFEKELEIRFTYHSPKEGQPEKYTKIRQFAFELAKLLEEECPDSREKSLALTKLEEAVMWANAAIARRE